MPTCPLPPDPSLVQLHKRARELQRGLRSGDQTAVTLLAEHHPDGRAADAPLHLAQLVLARVYGFASWPRLVAHLHVLEQFSATPDLDRPEAETQDRFLTHAVLRYGPDDGPARWAVARELLQGDPNIGRATIFAASATADHAAVQRFLASDHGLAGRRGGPLGWAPLLYLAYARLDPTVAESDVLATARLLLDAGADPNAGFLWHGLSTPFTVLTGTLGSGEQGIGNQPPHPHALPLSRLLLAAGADPNDGQTLYNRMFEHDDTHLELLFEFGLGSGDGGPWHQRMPELTDSPSQLVRSQLSWAISHRLTDRIRLLAAHGVDLASPLRMLGSPGQWTTPVELALLSGFPRLAVLLADLGATPAEPDAGAQLVGALLSGDAAQVEVLTTALPGLLDRVRREYPALILRAAVLDSRPGLELLLARGFDVNALGRQDLPIAQKWESALHHAAGEGDLDLALTLLAAGADPNIHDRRFDATPLGWAENFDRRELVELLRPLTDSGQV